MRAFSTTLHGLFDTEPAFIADTDLQAWAAHCRALEAGVEHCPARALIAGFDAPCVAFAFAGGYQAALSRLFGPAAEPAFRAFCVTEREGNRPRQLRTTLSRADRGWRLDGEKSYVTGGARAALLYIAARDASVESDMPAIRLVCIPAQRSGVTIATLPAIDWLPELPHVAVRLDAVDIGQNEILPGDGYTRYVKPFRSIEDVHVELALLGHFWRQSRALRDAQSLCARIAAHVANLFAAAELAADDPALHLLLAGNRDMLVHTVAALETAWEHGNPDFYRDWLRDRRLLQVAGAARDARTARAWQKLTAPD